MIPFLTECAFVRRRRKNGAIVERKRSDWRSEAELATGRSINRKDRLLPIQSILSILFIISIRHLVTVDFLENKVKIDTLIQ